jgi:hypothetical protein
MMVGIIGIVASIVGVMGKAKSKKIAVFNPEDWRKILEDMGISAREMAKSIGIPKVFTQTKKNYNPRLSTCIDFTENILTRNRNRKYKTELPERMILISPYKLGEELEKKDLSCSAFHKQIKGKVSKATIVRYVAKDFGPWGPRFHTIRVLSEGLNNIKEIKVEKGNKEIGEKKWDFYSAQREWLDRDKKNLDKLKQKI